MTNAAATTAPIWTPCFRVHLKYTDGRTIDTPTGTLSYSHAYTRRNGKVYTQASIERKFNKAHAWKGLEVVAVEKFYFDANL